MKIWDKYLELLYGFFLYDVEVFSKPWIYWCLLVPAMFYFSFFVLKWVVLTLPLWLPLRLIITAVTRKTKTKCDHDWKRVTVRSETDNKLAYDLFTCSKCNKVHKTKGYYPECCCHETMIDPNCPVCVETIKIKEE